MSPTQVAFQGEGESFTLEVFGLRWRIRPVGLPDDVRDKLLRLWSRAVVDPASPGPEVQDVVVVPETTVLDDHGDRDADGDGDGTGVGDGPAGSGGDGAGDAGSSATDRLDLEIAPIGSSWDHAPYNLSRALTLASIRRKRGQALMLHAVGVCGQDGRTVALVAPSGTGKTTAASTLGRTLGYVTDETVVIEHDDVIAPYPKPLSVIVDEERRYEKHEWSPDDLGLGPTPSRPTLGAVVLIRRDLELTEPSFELISLADAIIACIPESSALTAIPDPLARLARALCAGGGPYQLRYAEIADCADLLTELTREDPERDASAPAWEHLPPERTTPGEEAPEADATDDRSVDPGPARDASAPPVADGPAEAAPWTTVTWQSVVRRRPWDDAVLSDGEIVVLHDLIPSRLSRLGSALWQLSAADATVPELHRQIVELMGEHPRSEALVLKGLQDLVEAKVVVIVADPAAPSASSSSASRGPAAAATESSDARGDGQ